MCGTCVEHVWNMCSAVCRHECVDIRGHVSGYVCRHVCAHMFADVCVDMYADMPIVFRIGPMASKLGSATKAKWFGPIGRCVPACVETFGWTMCVGRLGGTFV